jgi:hypothetical protein
LDCEKPFRPHAVDGIGNVVIALEELELKNTTGKVHVWEPNVRACTMEIDIARVKLSLVADLKQVSFYCANGGPAA